jgi:hypothetical protein
MRKTLAALALALTSFAITQRMPVLADDYWFDHYDHDHDHHWDYNEFRRAHHAWEREHRAEKRLNDAELREQWARLDADHRGWVDMDRVKPFHNW